MGLGGTVVMVGAREEDAEITAEAGMWATSWSMLGLVGSSARQMQISPQCSKLVRFHMKITHQELPYQHMHNYDKHIILCQCNTRHHNTVSNSAALNRVKPF